MAMVQRGILKPKPRPRFVEPMECKRVSKLPEGKDWVYEIKQDGYRAIGLVDGSSAMLYSMPGQNYTSDFPHITFALKNLRRGNLVLDGEIVALDARGRASFEELQNRRTSRQPIVFYVFDVLHFNGRDTLDLTLDERRRLLDQLGAHFSDPLRVNPLFRTDLPPLIQQVKTLGLEGVVAKRSDSPYIPGRESDAWQKHRFNREAEFVIGDLEPDQQEQETGSGNADDMYSRMEGAETGADRSPRKLQPGASRHTTEPEQVAHEGQLSTRTPKRPAQGITSRSAEEESERQEKVVNDRPEPRQA